MIKKNAPGQKSLKSSLNGGLEVLVDPGHGDRVPLDQLLILEPEGDLLGRRVGAVRSVADIATDLDTEVSTDGSRGGGSGVGLAQHDAAGLDDIEAFPDHGHDGSGVHVLD